jgi:hypothetical protein
MIEVYPHITFPAPKGSEKDGPGSESRVRSAERLSLKHTADRRGFEGRYDVDMRLAARLDEIFDKSYSTRYMSFSYKLVKREKNE